MTNIHFTQLLAVLHNKTIVYQSMQQLDMGAGKVRKVAKFNGWLEMAENSMTYTLTNTEMQTINLLSSWGANNSSTS